MSTASFWKRALLAKILEMRAKGVPIRKIAKELGCAKNTVKKYLREHELKEPAAAAAKAHQVRGTARDPLIAQWRSEPTEGTLDLGDGLEARLIQADSPSQENWRCLSLRTGAPYVFDVVRDGDGPWRLASEEVFGADSEEGRAHTLDVGHRLAEARNHEARDRKGDG